MRKKLLIGAGAITAIILIIISVIVFNNTHNYKEKEETKIIYIKEAYVKNNKNYVVIDFIEWLGPGDWKKIKQIEGFTGNEEECKDQFLLDDYYIYNEKEENIVMEVDKQAEIIRLPASGEPSPFIGEFGEFSTHNPHEILIKKGIIIKIEQRYIP